MKNTVISIVGAATLFLASVCIAGPVNMQEGNWDIATSVKVEGVAFTMPAMKITHCYTKKEIEGTNNPAAGDKKSDCELKDQKTSGNTATWNLACKDGSTGSGTVTHSGKAFTMSMKNVDKMGGKSTTTMQGKRRGRRGPLFRFTTPSRKERRH